MGEFWIVDVNAARIIRLRQPNPEGYGLRDEIRGRMSLEALPGCIIDLDSLFPI